jgi:hypothetical protein
LKLFQKHYSVFNIKTINTFLNEIGLVSKLFFVLPSFEGMLPASVSQTSQAKEGMYIPKSQVTLENLTVPSSSAIEDIFRFYET